MLKLVSQSIPKRRASMIMRIVIGLLVASALSWVIWQTDAVGQPVDASSADPGGSTTADRAFGSAPEWPFRGFVVPELGRYWDTDRGEYVEVGGRRGFGACRELYVDVGEAAIRSGYRAFENYMGHGETHYVTPWGDIAYPVIRRDVPLSRDEASIREVVPESQASIADRIVFEPVTVVRQHEEGEGGGETSRIVGFSASNDVSKRWYRPIESVRGFVEFVSDGSPIEELISIFAEDEAAGRHGWFFNVLATSGTDGRYYSFSLYRRAHAACSSTARSFVVDGTDGTIVACLETRMDRVTPLIFVEPDRPSEFAEFGLPSAPMPVGLDSCPVRLDEGHAAGFFLSSAVSGTSRPSGRTKVRQ